MPAHQKRYQDVIRFAPWIDALEDRCLREIVIQAFESRRVAIETQSSPKLVRAGDATMEQVEYGKLKGQKAWQAATSALRHFDEAWMNMSPGTRKG